MTWARAENRRGKRAQIYVRQYQGPAARVALAPLATGFLLVVVVVAVIVVSDAVTLAGAREAEVGLLLAALSGIPFVAALYVAQRRTDRRKLIELAYRVCGEQEPRDRDMAALRRARSAFDELPDDLLLEVDRAYCQLVGIIVADGMADPNEMERLRRTEDALELPDEHVANGRLQGFLDVYDAAIEDGILTEDEQWSLDQIRQALRVPERSIAREMKFTRQLERARQAKEQPLEPQTTSYELSAGEHAYHVTMATARKRTIETVQRPAGESREAVYEPTDSGNFYVTNRRLVFEAGRTRSIELATLRDVSIDAESKYLVLVADGKKDPYYFELPQPYVTDAYIERLLRES